MATARRVIVNADDFGQTPGINAGIVRAFEHGIVTSASLMVRSPHADEAADYARAHPALSIGLHIDLGEWTFEHGEWTARYQVLPNEDRDAVREEFHHQLDLFRRLMGREPTHLDSHQHVHHAPPLAHIAVEYATPRGIPIRDRATNLRYDGAFYGQSTKGYSYPEGVSPPRLAEILRGLPAGTTELGCHPGLGQDAGGMYITERELEVRALCDPMVRQTLRDEAIELVSFHDVRVT